MGSHICPVATLTLALPKTGLRPERVGDQAAHAGPGLLGVVYMTWFAPLLLPKRESLSTAIGATGAREYLTELVIGPSCAPARCCQPRCC